MDDHIVFGGHSTVFIKMDKAIMLTDPNLSPWVWTLKRKTKPGLNQKQLESVNMVLVSHGHYDHLDLPTVKRLNRDAVIIVPKGLERYFTRNGFKDVRTLTWWEQTTVHNTRIIAVPANHFKGRHPLVSSLYQGYVIDGKYQIYFAGDTGWFDGLRDIGDIFRLNIAMLPIGAYKPWAILGHHMTPEDCVNAMQVIKAQYVIPIHWGTFKLSFERMDEPVERLLSAAKRAGVERSIRILKPGDKIVIPELVNPKNAFAK
ncbi:MAG: MBL fold metallo-hydrolase [bacterium]